MTKHLPLPLLSRALQALFAPGQSHLRPTPTPSPAANSPRPLFSTAPAQAAAPVQAPVQKHCQPLANTVEAQKEKHPKAAQEHRCTSSALSTPCSIHPIHAPLTHRQRRHAGRSQALCTKPGTRGHFPCPSPPLLWSPKHRTAPKLPGMVILHFGMPCSLIPITSCFSIGLNIVSRRSSLIFLPHTELSLNAPYFPHSSPFPFLKTGLILPFYRFLGIWTDRHQLSKTMHCGLATPSESSLTTQALTSSRAMHSDTKFQLLRWSQS